MPSRMLFGLLRKSTTQMRRLKTLLLLSLTIVAATVAGQEKKQAMTVQEIEADADFLYLPIDPKAPLRDVCIMDAGGKIIHNMPVMLSSGKGQWFAPFNVSKYKGQKLKVVYPSKELIGTPIILFSDQSFERDWAADVGRPRFHLTATNGLLGSSSGLFKLGDTYYAYFLQNEASFGYDGMFNLCLAQTRDFVNWSYIKNPKLLKSPIFSPASVCVDSENRSGLFSSTDKKLIMASTDKNFRTFFAFSKNFFDIEVIEEAKIGGTGQWPYLFFNKDSGLWTLLRTESSADGKSAAVAIYVSKNLRKWEKTGQYFPELGQNNAVLVKAKFEGIARGTKWAMISGDGRYIVGDFDGRQFKRITKKPLNILAGTITFVQPWANTDESQTLITATIQQPADIMRSLGQKFANTLSLPWELRFVTTADGQIQLRADVPDKFKAHINVPMDASGGDMSFSSNTFVVPNAYGNYSMYAGIFRKLKGTDAVRFEVGTAVFGYDIKNSEFFIRRIIYDIGQWKIPVKRDVTDIPFTAFVDSYSTEMYWFTGDTVLMAGDSFINPHQTIRVGAFGDIFVPRLERSSILRRELKELNKIINDARIKRNPQKNAIGNTSPAVSAENKSARGGEKAPNSAKAAELPKQPKGTKGK